jgi:hypothetical protein
MSGTLTALHGCEGLDRGKHADVHDEIRLNAG